MHDTRGAADGARGRPKRALAKLLCASPRIHDAPARINNYRSRQVWHSRRTANSQRSSWAYTLLLYLGRLPAPAARPPSSAPSVPELAVGRAVLHRPRVQGTCTCTCHRRSERASHIAHVAIERRIESAITIRPGVSFSLQRLPSRREPFALYDVA